MLGLYHDKAVVWKKQTCLSVTQLILTTLTFLQGATQEYIFLVDTVCLYLSNYLPNNTCYFIIAAVKYLHFQSKQPWTYDLIFKKFPDGRRRRNSPLFWPVVPFKTQTFRSHSNHPPLLRLDQTLEPLTCFCGLLVVGLNTDWSRWSEVNNQTRPRVCLKGGWLASENWSRYSAVWTLSAPATVKSGIYASFPVLLMGRGDGKLCVMKQAAGDKQRVMMNVDHQSQPSPYSKSPLKKRV